MLQRAVEHKVIYVVGSAFFVDGSGSNLMRLSFSLPTEERIVEGVARLAAALIKRRSRARAWTGGLQARQGSAATRAAAPILSSTFRGPLLGLGGTDGGAVLRAPGAGGSGPSSCT